MSSDYELSTQRPILDVGAFQKVRSARLPHSVLPLARGPEADGDEIEALKQDAVDARSERDHLLAIIANVLTQ